MSIFKNIMHEFKHHVPFTAAGAFLGILLMLILDNFFPIHGEKAHHVFEILHPMHVILSAMVTAAMYQHHTCNHDKKICHVPMFLVVGYIGSIGIATISDSLVPYWGELLMGMESAEVHIGFIENPLQISLAALFGIIIAYYSPMTKFPHAGHVFLSTAASMFHIMEAKEGALSIIVYLVVFVFLFLSVWLPCCLSDIAFPLLFAKRD